MFYYADYNPATDTGSVLSYIKPFRSDSEGLSLVPLYSYPLRLACACRASYGRLRGFSVCLACMPCAAGISPYLTLYYGNMTTFTSGVNIHMSIHFIMVTR